MENWVENNQIDLAHCKSVDEFISKDDNRTPLDLAHSFAGLGGKSSRKTERSMVPQKSFNFEEVSRKTCKADYVNRIHGKMSTKRVGGKVLFVGRKQKKEEAKENRLSYTKLGDPKKSEAYQSPQNICEGNHSNLISIKSYQPDACIDSMGQTSRSHNRNFSNLTEEGFKGQREVDEIFKEVKRKLEKDQQLSRTISKKRNCFFTNLKKKLQQEVRRTSQQKERDGMTLLIEGCHAFQHEKVKANAYLKVQKQIKSQRPRTAAHKTTLTFDQSVKGEMQRPKSCRTNQPQSPRFLKEASLKFLEKKQRSTVKEKRPSSGQSRRLQTRSSSSLYSKVRNSKTDAEISSKACNVSTRLGQIINDCDNQRVQGDLKSNMNTFEFYCKRMDEGMDRANRKLQEVQCMDID